ncbi:MAG: DUF4870 domain-containing protein [Chloroflexota bacterium]|jgi:uncharacterized membrane protein
MSEMPASPDGVTSDDRLWALLSYLLTPLIPIIILLMEDKKSRPYIKAHFMQALVLGIALIIFNTIMAFIPIINCISPLVTLGLLIWLAVRANKGEYISLPVITDFVKNQGWA